MLGIKYLCSGYKTFGLIDDFMFVGGFDVDVGVVVYGAGGAVDFPGEF